MYNESQLGAHTKDPSYLFWLRASGEGWIKALVCQLQCRCSIGQPSISRHLPFFPKSPRCVLRCPLEASKAPRKSKVPLLSKLRRSVSSCSALLKNYMPSKKAKHTFLSLCLALSLSLSIIYIYIDTHTIFLDLFICIYIVTYTYAYKHQYTSH